MPEDIEIRSFYGIPIAHFPDKSARWLLQNKENVRGLLEIVASELVPLIDFDQLAQLNRSFIADTLREQESDILFSVPFQREEGTEELLIYILIEHQSTVDLTMGFRILFYMTQIWDSQRQEWQSNNVPKSDWRLRPILPIVFYNGERRWNVPLTLAAIMDIPDILSRFIPKFDTLFLNVKETNTADLTKTDHPFGWLLTVLQQEHASKASIIDALVEAIAHLIPFDAEHSEQSQRAINYLLLLILHQRPAKEHQELIKLVEQHTPKMEVETMAKSMADILRQQGIEQGIEQGKAEGIAQGKAEGIAQGETRAKQASVLKLLQFRFNNIPESIADQVASIRSLARLDALFEQVWDAETLDEIDFRDDNK